MKDSLWHVSPLEASVVYGLKGMVGLPHQHGSRVTWEATAEAGLKAELGWVYCGPQCSVPLCWDQI